MAMMGRINKQGRGATPDIDGTDGTINKQGRGATPDIDGNDGMTLMGGAAMRQRMLGNT
jgi:hypothetical protein